MTNEILKLGDTVCLKGSSEPVFVVKNAADNQRGISDFVYYNKISGKIDEIKLPNECVIKIPDSSGKPDVVFV
jgi:hypothetical protein